ncbi:MAG TPA: thioredoxin domain-containing protein [Aliidongia sp.]|nr:thioredoxin domain-containing protein [Aliidongia sp.]
MSENQLGHETSPYLLQHKDNPVHWRAWSPAVLADAQAQDKPILLSIGYAACHWCHVMAHESFENPAIAGVMNELFVPIKVDREERPDLDAIYQHALALLGEQGGWPLTMFLTPDAKPFWGGTYFPPASRWGRPGFPDVLRGIAQAYREQKDKISTNVEAIGQGLTHLSQPKSAGPVPLSELDPIAERFLANIDPRHGGIGGAPKFPNCSILELLWRGYRRTDNEAMREAVLNTLIQMSQGGIYDHLGGGFARYSVDERWLVPHFEKMLYDNAQLVELLAWAWQETASPLYGQRIEETIGWLLREMMAPAGGFASTLDADSEHEEGKFYVWTEAEIDRLLGADAGLFKSRYDVTTEGNWEGKTILNRSAHLTIGDDATEAALARSRSILFEARAPRVRPGRDDKVLADWNGLMISALVRAADALDRPAWLDAAKDAYRFVTTTMMSGDRLVHSWREGRTHPGTLDDYADMSRAALLLHEATGDGAYLDQARAWAAALDQHFADPAGGYFFTADDTESLIVRTKTANDSAVPAGNGTMIQVLARLYILTGEESYRDKADALVAAFSGELERNFFPLATYLNGIDFLGQLLQLVVVGAREDETVQAFLSAAQRRSQPNLVIQVVSPDASLPPGHPAAGKGQIDGRATAYICAGRVCSLPITDPTALDEALRHY